AEPRSFLNKCHLWPVNAYHVRVAFRKEATSVWGYRGAPRGSGHGFPATSESTSDTHLRTKSRARSATFEPRSPDRGLSVVRVRGPRGTAHRDWDRSRARSGPRSSAIAPRPRQSAPLSRVGPHRAWDAWNSDTRAAVARRCRPTGAAHPRREGIT